MHLSNVSNQSRAVNSTNASISNHTYMYYSTECGFPQPELELYYSAIMIVFGIIFVNTMTSIIFLQKRNRSPNTITLAALAISDGLTAMGFGMKLFVGLMFFDFQNTSTFDGHTWGYIPQQECIIYHMSSLSALLFHQISVLLTTFLSVQKSFAILIPFWCKLKIRREIFPKIIFAIYGIAAIIHLPLVVTVSHFYAKTDYERAKKGTFIMFIALHMCITNIIQLVCILLVIVCSVVICCKLTCFRKHFRPIERQTNRTNYNRSALLILLVCIIFILSETLNVLYWISGLLSFLSNDSFDEFQRFVMYYVVKYLDISLLIGFLLNFLIYLGMSQELKGTAQMFLRRLFKICK